MTSTSSSIIRWPDDLPLVKAFNASETPTQTILSLTGALQHDGEETVWVLGAASLLRSWWKALPDQGHRLDPYPDLTGDAHIWNALRLVAGAGAYPTADGTWNLLRRAEANIRAWYLEHTTGQGITVLIETNE